MNIAEIRIPISRCIIGVYLRWWFNGWHYFNFTNGYEVSMGTENMDTQVSRMFSVISKIERPTKLTAEYSYQITVEGITAGDIPGFTGLLMAEKVEQYEYGKWYEVEITRGDHLIKDENAPGYILDFEITRKELPYTPAVYQKSIKLYLGDILCDLDDDELVPINKQVNDIAEMQDRQSDYTTQFKIRKTRIMRSLFELSGEVGIDTTFPYKKQPCKLIQENIEMITAGIMILDRVDDQYYYVSILSGNQNFFKLIGNLKLVDLLLPSTNHDWTIADIAASHAASPETDWLYPLCEPSDDSGIAVPPDVVGNIVNMYGGYIWPFIRVSTIWNEIFVNAGFRCTGDILTNDTFLRLFMPITNLKITKIYTDKYLYSSFRRGYMPISMISIFGVGGTGMNNLINGDYDFATGHYIAPFTVAAPGYYKLQVNVTFLTPTPTIYLYKNGAWVKNFTMTWSDGTNATYEIEYEPVAATDNLSIWGTANTYYSVSTAIIEINDAKMAYGSPIVPHLFLPAISQTDFIKIICNMFGLIPDVTSRDHKIHFWNYSDLYKNIPIARDWSAYLSEKDDKPEFKFGDYAQNNYLKYKDSEDVFKDQGKGIMQVEDETLKAETNIVNVPISTCDEVIIATTNPIVVSRIAFNKWYDDAGTYKQGESIDARIVYIKRADGIEFIVWDNDQLVGVDNVNNVHINNPYIASSLEISFSSLVVNYAALSRMLTRADLRRAKLNLPVYEIAGLKHNIPIYFDQYKAYFCVNKINNFVSGKLNINDLIEL